MQDKILLLGILLLAQTLFKVHGLRCLTCDNARSKSDCLRKGRPILTVCQAGQRMSCQTEIRYHGGGRPTISKRCKQFQACESDRRQNSGAAAGSTQCNSGKKNSVCRCCCQENLCNLADFWCESAGTRGRCELLSTPSDGSKNCRYRSHEGEIGSRCTFSCDEGFLMKGRELSVCRRTTAGSKPKFNSAPPGCERLPPEEAKNTSAVLDCATPPPAPLNGGRSCLKSREGMICSYFCGENESIVGTGVATCRANAGWDTTTPECIPDCDKVSIVNGVSDCDGNWEAGTTCKFFCNFGYEMIGSPSTECVIQGGKTSWSLPPPVCESSDLVP